MNPHLPVLPFTLNPSQTFNSWNSGSTNSDAFILRYTPVIYGFAASNLLSTWHHWPHLCPRQGSLRATTFSDWQWREADAPLFTGPLTFLLKLPLMPPQPTAAPDQGGKELKDSFVIVWPLKSWQFLRIVFLLSSHFNRVITHDAQRDGFSPETKHGITKCFLCLSLYFSGLFLQYRLRTSFGVPRTRF